MCRAKLGNRSEQPRKERLQKLEESRDFDSDESEKVFDVRVQNTNAKQVQTILRIGRKNQIFLIDTGASCSVMSLRDFRRLCPNQSIKESKKVLLTYNNSELKPQGEADVIFFNPKSNEHFQIPV